MATNLSAVTSNLFHPRKFHIPKGYTIEDLFEIVQQHNMLKPVYQTLWDYYRGNHIILNRTFDDRTKPNNKIVHNYPRLIVENSVSYFMGKPVTYMSENENLKEDIEDLSNYNNEDDVNAELVKLSAVYGHAFEILWIDSEGKVRFKPINPANIVMLYSMDIEEEPLCAVHYRAVDTGKIGQYKFFLTVYDKTHITEFVGEGNQPNTQMTKISSTPHHFKEVPVVEYIANEDRIGDFETVISLIDAYNLSVSDSVNDINYLNEAYLMLKNLIDTDEEAVEDMKNNRIMLLDEEGDAKWLVKQVNDKHIENIKERLVGDIHKFSMTPNLADEKFASNLSGVAISYKLIGLENKTAVRERKFATGLRHRLNLMVNILNLKGKSYDPLDIKPVFTRNIPQNISDLVNTVISLQDIVPDEDLLSILPFIENPQQTLEKLKKQRESDKETYEIGADLDLGGGNFEQEGYIKDKEDTRSSQKPNQDKQTLSKPRKSRTK